MTFRAFAPRVVEQSMGRRHALTALRHDRGASGHLHLPSGLSCPCDGGCPRCAAGVQPGRLIGLAGEHLLQRPTRPGVGSAHATRFSVSPANDASEREAQYVAGQIMRPVFPGGSPVKSPADLLPGPLVIAPARGVTAGPTSLSSAATQAIRHPHGGQLLPTSVRDFLQPRFGVDFGSVHVHTGSQAAGLSALLQARAFTCGRDIWLGAGESTADLSLLAHELTHVLQQCAQAGTGAIQREAAPRPGQCDPAHLDDINAALGTARMWRDQVLTWFETHLNNLRRRTPPTVGAYGRVGALVVRDLARLEHDFRISDLIRARGSAFPHSENDPIDAHDLRNFADASSEIRRRFREVDLEGLTFGCRLAAPPQPRAGRLRQIWAESPPGSHQVTVFTDLYDVQVPDTRAAIVLHEAFHATSADFDQDTYSFEAGYPGDDPLTNADSFANFASIVATGQSYRVMRLPEMRIAVPSPVAGGP